MDKRGSALYKQRMFGLILLILLHSPAAVAAPSFQEVYDKVIDAKCTNCHGFYKAERGVRFRNYEDVMHYVPLRDTLKSEILQITDSDTMPDFPVEPLTQGQKYLLREWILNGAPR